MLNLQVNTVFDHLHATKDFSGYVFFLEEDHYVSPDFVKVTKKLIDLKETSCHDCDLVNLGTYQKANYGNTGKQVSLKGWLSSSDASKFVEYFNLPVIPTYILHFTCTQCIYTVQ